jgi:hypothetical protein
LVPTTVIPDCLRVTVDVEFPLSPVCSIVHVPVTLGGLAKAATNEVAAIATPHISEIVKRFILR